MEDNNFSMVLLSKKEMLRLGCLFFCIVLCGIGSKWRRTPVSVNFYFFRILLFQVFTEKPVSR
jgi:hypothetical protein